MPVKESEKFIVNLLESMLRAQLNALKQARKSLGFVAQKASKEQRTSRMDMVYDVLVNAHRPMHVDDIILDMGKRFGVKPDKDSLVSALTKRIQRQDRFQKTAPNTFSLISQDVAEGGQQ